MPPATNILDHIVHLSPPGKLFEAVEYWESLGFKVIPGGQHADGLTSNALVPVSDGIYIELIAFNEPADSYPPDSPRSKHWWANKSPGWIDWACLGLEDNINQTIAKREKEVGSGVEYMEGQVGGRKRVDGTELKWRVTFPELKHGRGNLPFFCQDLTQRELRVPSADANTHPNSAFGISHIHLSVPENALPQVQSQLSVVLGHETTLSDEWQLGAPRSTSAPVPHLKLSKSTPGVTTPSIEEVGVFVGKSKGRQIDTPKGLGKILFIEVE